MKTTFMFAWSKRSIFALITTAVISIENSTFTNNSFGSIIIKQASNWWSRASSTDNNWYPNSNITIRGNHFDHTSDAAVSISLEQRYQLDIQALEQHNSTFKQQKALTSRHKCFLYQS